MAFLVHSPVDLMVIDSQGWRIGYDPVSGQVINEIPGDYYTGNSSNVEFILYLAARGWRTARPNIDH